ncbi:hypothetical protein SDC9_112225 [bioreactor metagenome]|uniref:Uncharacterized protein n=1 Tax=bioreactor metagenome TaxID=1076179 RepID=A0A645BIN6_9ZZZZ
MVLFTVMREHHSFAHRIDTDRHNIPGKHLVYEGSVLIDDKTDSGSLGQCLEHRRLGEGQE